MSSTEQSVNNYFDALQNFFNTWVKTFENTLSNEPGAKVADMEIDAYSKQMDNFLSQMRNMAQKDADQMQNTTPEQYQQQVLSSLKMFEQAYQEGSQMVEKMLQMEEQYVNSDAFLNDYQQNMQRSNDFYNSMLNGISNMLNTYTQALEKADN